ncbi:MAG TPA: hypothetical protein VE133_18500, partial [Candidatus Sulfotelmatobacter sp.]|nr:hypothetical protein [Candidatus Sulfotelmatobacter sp.]
LKNLKLSAQYDRPEQPDVSVLQPYSGASYVAAEEFWIREFRNAAHPVPAIKLTNSPSTSTARVVNAELSEKLSSAYGLAFPDLALSCYAALLARISGQDQAAVVASLDEKEPFPLLFQTGADSTFAEFARAGGEKLEQARAHRLFPFFILMNPLRMKEFGMVCPSFKAGCLVAGSPEITMAGRLEHYPAVNQQIDLLLTLTLASATDGTKFGISCPTGRYSQVQVEKIAEGFMSALEALSSRTDLKFKDFITDQTLAEKRAAAVSHQPADSTTPVHEELTRA